MRQLLHLTPQYTTVPVEWTRSMHELYEAELSHSPVKVYLSVIPPIPDTFAGSPGAHLCLALLIQRLCPIVGSRPLQIAKLKPPGA